MDTHNAAPQAATASEIRDIVGPVEDQVVEMILDEGPTRAEVLEAFTWLRSDQQLRHRPGFELEGKSARILEILESEEPDSDA
ncbi:MULTISPECIES: hypothetical protein [unclassified Cupriavidus]|uniref:hypothetical protein n=1 Tax=unclassified Cupriavidus TaxID=2640874 RepID=UPI001AE607E3|nr:MULTISPECIES: hypothetical protein [unclassified Cupriavidus]MBP0632851.1 hypothetical protein [Cupriavidus sp. AcVe19-1a]MBP0639191.1 hypothetical protein [Cupriavidus sp. AcVe19-6a]